MTAKITAPGIYELTLEEYHGEPCDGPSISSSGLRMLLDECPARYWWHSPLNPARPVVDKPEFSIGRAAHDFILQGDRFLETNVVLPADLNLRTKEGRAVKEQALATGKNVIGHDDFEAIKAMRDAMMAHEFAAAAFVNGRVEPSLAWRDRETGIWLRCRPDFLPAALRFIPDYKTAASAKPAKFVRAAYDFGYHMQAALYLDGIEAVTGTRPRSFFFVVQEKTPPYVVTCVALDSVAIEWGRMQNRKAIHVFAECLESGHWPGYESDVVEMPLPRYAEMELERQHDAGRFDVNREKAA